ncbi:beta-lactamase family protein [Nocardia salmonicida]|uniref:Beta-lactamase family protein n=1 Tax=Nocardia salmonicida TaxID=53431 RepID=A0ABZ1N0X7_9NOCA
MTRSLSPADMAWTKGFLDPAHVRQHATTVRDMSPTRAVWRGTEPAWTLPRTSVELTDLPVRWTFDRTVPLSQALREAETDALVVLHRGRVVHEQYLHEYRSHVPHLNASLAKSYIGLLAALLEEQGSIRREDPAAKYVPELAGTGLGSARLQELLHMTTHVSFGDRPYDRILEAHRFWAVVAPGLRPPGYTGPQNILEHLATTRATGPFDTEFRYDNANVEVVAEVLRRITGVSTAELLSELVWSRIGAAEDGYYVLDPAGAEMACGGFAATAMDAARLGEILRCGGALGDQQVFPEAVVRSITDVPDGPTRRVRLPRDASGNPPQLGYHDFWWILNDPHGSYLASGIHGQHLFVSPGRELVAVHYGAQVLSPSVPPTPLVSLYAQIAAALDNDNPSNVFGQTV